MTHAGNSPTQPSILICGVGALACLFGARLSEHARVVLFGAWPEQIAALKRSRLTLRFSDGRWPERADLDARDNLEGLPPFDYVLILTKAYKTPQAAEAAAQALAPDGLAITLQNGLGSYELLKARLGEERAGWGVTALGAYMEAPAVLHAAGDGPTYLGLYGQPTKALKLTEVFNQAGITAQASDAIEGLAWAKLAANAAINPLTALLKVPNGRILEVEALRSLMHAAAAEVEAVAQARGLALPVGDAGAYAEQIAAASAHNTSSMLQDVLRGAPTEIDYINGAVVQHAKALGVPAPVNSVLYSLIKSLEALPSA